MVPVHNPVNKPTTQCTYHPVLTAAYCNPLQPIAITSSVHTLQQPLHLQCTHYSSHCIFSAHTTAAIASSVHTLQQQLHLQCTHYSSHCIFSTHTTAAIASSVHTLQQPLHLQCTHYSSHCIFSAHTTAAIASSVHTLQQPLHLQCTHYSSHYIFSAHCNHVQPCTAIYNHLHYSYTIQCTLQPCTAMYSHLQPPTLQLYHSVHTAATLSDANTIQCI